MDERQPENRPDARIKKATIRLRLESYDRHQKTGNEVFKGTSDGEIEAKKDPRFIAITKDNHSEEEEDQVDKWDIRIQPATPPCGFGIPMSAPL
jgi:hypothetical protein